MKINQSFAFPLFKLFKPKCENLFISLHETRFQLEGEESQAKAKLDLIES